MLSLQTFTNSHHSVDMSGCIADILLGPRQPTFVNLRASDFVYRGRASKRRLVNPLLSRSACMFLEGVRPRHPAQELRVFCQ